MIAVAFAIWLGAATVFGCWLGYDLHKARRAAPDIHAARRQAMADLAAAYAARARYDNDADILAELERRTDWCDPHGIDRP